VQGRVGVDVDEGRDVEVERVARVEVESDAEVEVAEVNVTVVLGKNGADVDVLLG
jgi:hypothetical protein